MLLLLLLCALVTLSQSGLVNVQRKKQRDAVYEKASKIISKEAKDEEDAKDAEYARYMEQIKQEIQKVKNFKNYVWVKECCITRSRTPCLIPIYNF